MILKSGPPEVKESNEPGMRTGSTGSETGRPHDQGWCVTTMHVTEKHRSVHVLYSRCTRTKWWYAAFICIILSLHIFTIQFTIPRNGPFTGASIDSVGCTFPSDEPLPSFGPQRWSDIKLAIYMTTHLPDVHLAYLPCWKDAIQRLPIFKNADLILYTSANPTEKQLQSLPFRNITIKQYNNPGYQEGAIQAMIDPFLENVTWFDQYDWVIRINMDVLIRDDIWLIQTMLNPSVDMIALDCRENDSPVHFQTDFNAFRPSAVDRERLLQANRTHAETHLTDAMIHIYDAGRLALIPGGKNEIQGHCRITGVHSPVLHEHELSQYCPYYYNVHKEGVFR